MSITTSLSRAVCLALMFTLNACSRQAEPTAPQAAAAPEVAQEVSARSRSAAAPPMEALPQKPAAADSIAGSVTAVTPAAQMGSSAAVYEDGVRKFIRTASARFAVKDVYAAALGIEDTVAAHGGFVVSNGISTEILSTSTHPAGKGKLVELREYGVQGNLVVRVPSAKTQEFLRAIVRHISFLDERQFAARDAQFDLLRQQLDARRNQETQNELGQAISEGGKLAAREAAITSRDQSKAARDEAIIAAKVFEDQVAFSTITLALYQPSRVLQAEKIDVDSVVREHQPGFLTRLGEGLAGGWHGLLNLLLALAAVWPLTLALLVAATLLWRAARRRRVKPAVDAG